MINAALRSSIDVSSAQKLKANSSYCFEGVKPTGKGFIITESKVNQWTLNNLLNSDVLKLFSTGINLTRMPNCTPTRWIIDFSDMPLEVASQYLQPFEHVRTYVKPERAKNREVVMREKWWRFKRTNAAMRTALRSLNYYFAVPRVSKWTIFVVSPINWLPGDSVNVVSSTDFYILGILTSTVHRQWVKAQSSTLKGDTRYTHKTCFETFPFPQTPNPKLIEQIRTATQDLHAYRTAQMTQKQWGITQLYNQFFHESASQLAQLHAQLDKLVLKAYNFQKNDDLLEKLLELNLELAAQEKQGEAIIGPWAPDNLPPGV